MSAFSQKGWDTLVNVIDTAVLYVSRFSAGMLIVLTLLIIFDALSRYLFHTGSIALQELEWHLFDLIILFGIAYALQEGAHVRVDIFYSHFSARKKAWIDIISQLFFILPFSVLVIYMGFDFVLQSFIQTEGSSDPGGLPYRFLVKSLMLISFALVILQSAGETIKRVRGLKG